EKGRKKAVWKENMKMIKLHNGENDLGKNDFIMEMIAFGDMLSIYYEPYCSSRITNHAMLMVGYGFEGKESDGRKYWLVKNRENMLSFSLSLKWGIRGYMKIARDQRNHCGIATYAMYPT
ncbi:hypothetical protein A6R68_13333, partial [Neotoma lepida]